MGGEKVRLSKRLSELDLCSRREGDRLISKGLVLVDGKVVNTLGEKVYRHQRVELVEAGKRIQSKRRTILLNKPVGFVSHSDDNKFYSNATSLLLPENFWPKLDTQTNNFMLDRKGFAPAGRLDIESTGMLVLTQDGTVAKRLIGADNSIEKEYLVKVKGQLTENGMDALRNGRIVLYGKPLKKADVRWQNEDQLRFVLMEGKMRQIRKMCELVGLSVLQLQRVRIGRVSLGKLPLGHWRFLRNHERF
jgi:23S rRNA pseudouridine2604 synthase